MAPKKPVKKVVKAKPKAPAGPLRDVESAVAKIAKRVDGRYCYGLPHYTLDTKLRFQLIRIGDLELFEENEVDRDELPDWIPFASLKDEPQFLAIKTVAPFAVGMWEHENGEIYTVWPSLADFAARVIDKATKTPFELLAKTLDKVGKLVEADAFAKALAIIEPAIRALPTPAAQPRFDDRSAARAYNLYGLALKGVDRWPEARAAFERSAHAGNNYAELNILDLFEDEKNPRAVIAHGLKCREEHYFDDYCRVWLARYLGFAYLDVGDAANAELELRRIVDGYAVSAPAKVTEVREALEKYLADKRPGAAIAGGFLAWLRPKTYEVTPAEAKRNRAWWTALPQGMRDKLLEEIDKEGATSASDEDIARCMDVESLNLDDDDGTFDALEPFLALPRLTRLSFYGDPETLAPLRALERLERLTVNNDVIKGFAWPSRADRDLWKAAEAGDRKGIEKALAAGASLASRGDHGNSALHLAAHTHDVELCLMLIARGADPWSGTHHGGEGISGFFGDAETIAKFEAAAKQAGIAHPDAGGWRYLDHGHMPAAATFESPDGLELDLDKGEPLADKWPKDVRFPMAAPKKHAKLYDLLGVRYGGLLASEKLADALRGQPNLELLPAMLVDHAGKPRPERYFLLNPLAIDALVVEKCFPQWNHIDPDSITDYAALVVDPAKLGAAKLWRPDLLNSRPVVIAKELADTLAGFSSVQLSHTRR